MANDLTGEFDVVAEFAMAAANRVLASMHRGERFLHSISTRVDDTQTGPNHGSVLGVRDVLGSAIANHDLLGDPPPTPPSGGSGSPFSILDGIVNTNLAGVAIDPIVPSHLKGRAQLQLFPPTLDVPDNSGKRLTVRIPMMSRYFPDPQTSPLAQFIRGEIQITASINQVVSQMGRVVEVDMRSANVSIGFSTSFASRPLPSEDIAAVALLLRNALKNSFLPSNANLPPNIAQIDFKTLRGAQNALAVLLNLRSATSSNPASVASVFLGTGDDFAFAAGADFVKASFQPTLDNILSQGVDDVHFNINTLLHTFHITYNITLNSAVMTLETGKMVLTVKGHAHTDRSWLPDFDFTVKQNLSLAPDGATANLVIGDLSLDTDSWIVDRFRGGAISSIARARDRALAQSNAQQTVRKLLSADENLGSFLTSLLNPPDNSVTNPLPEPPRLAYTAVDIRPSGIVLHGTVAVPAFPPPHVEFEQIPATGTVTSVFDGPNYSALKSWIPGGIIERYEWGRFGVQGTTVETNRFIFEDRPSIVVSDGGVASSDSGGGIVADPPVTAVIPGYHPLCLTVRGSRLSASGPVVAQPITGSMCGFNSFAVATAFSAADGATVPLVALAHTAPDGRVQVTGHTPARMDPTGTQVPNRLIHFADVASMQGLKVLVDALLESRRVDASTAVIAVAKSEDLASAPFVDGVTYADDDNGAWSSLYAATKARPSTLLLGPKGNVLWRYDGPLDRRLLVDTLHRHLVALQPLRVRLVPPSVRIGLPPPNLIFECAPGQLLPLRKLAGQNAALVFWRSSSRPSIEAVRDASSRDAGGRTPIVIAVNDGEPADVAKRAFAEHKLTANLLPDPDRAIARAYKVHVWPTTIVVDSRGRVSQVAAGREMPPDRVAKGA